MKTITITPDMTEAEIHATIRRSIQTESTASRDVPAERETLNADGRDPSPEHVTGLNKDHDDKRPDATLSSDTPSSVALPSATLSSAIPSSDTPSSDTPPSLELFFRAGTYTFSSGIKLEHARNMVIRGEPGTRWVGGLRLNRRDYLPADRLPGDHPAYRRAKRLPEDVRSHIMVWHLPDLAWEKIPGFASRGFRRDVVPGHPEIYVDDTPYRLARYPVDGSWLKITEYGQHFTDEWDWDMGVLSEGFDAEAVKGLNWEVPDDVIVQGYWANDWSMTYERLETLDAATGRIKLKPPHGNYSYKIGQRFRFHNVFEALCEPGTFYIDRASRCIFIYPEDGLRDDAEIYLTTLAEPLITIRESAGITLRDLELSRTCGRGIMLEHYDTITLSHLALCHIGCHGVEARYGTGLRIEGCDLFHIADAGIHVRAGDRRTLTPSHTEIFDCHFMDIAYWSVCYRPAIYFAGVGLDVHHCLIHDHPHAAIIYWGNDCHFHHNEIYHCCYETGDVGCIYAGGDLTLRGHVIRDNYLHHIGGVGWGSRAIYNDDCLCGTHIRGNYLYEANRAIFVGGGKDFVIEDNVIVNCRPAFSLDARGADPHPVWSRIYENFKQTFYHARLWPEDDPTTYDVAIDASRPPYTTKYPRLRAIDAMYRHDDPLLPDAVLRRNVVSPVVQTGASVLTDRASLLMNFSGDLGAWTFSGNHLAGKDIFEDPEWGLLALKADSAPIQQGVDPGTFEDIGLRTKRARKLPDASVYAKLTVDEDGMHCGFYNRGDAPQRVRYRLAVHVATADLDEAEFVAFHVRESEVHTVHHLEVELAPGQIYEHPPFALPMPSIEAITRVELTADTPGARPAIWYPRPTLKKIRKILSA